MLGGAHDEGTSVLGEALEHQRLPIRRPFAVHGLLRHAEAFGDVLPRPAELARRLPLQDLQPFGEGPEAATARSPTSGSTLVAPSAISGTGSIFVSVC